MKQDPLITYSSLIPGGLHYMPGGLNLPREKRTRNESCQPDWSPGADGTAQFAKILRLFTASLRKTLTCFRQFTVTARMSAIWPRQSGFWALIAEVRRFFYSGKRPAGQNSQCLHCSPPAALMPGLYNEVSAFGESGPPPNRG